MCSAVQYIDQEKSAPNSGDVPCQRAAPRMFPNAFEYTKIEKIAIRADEGGQYRGISQSKMLQVQFQEYFDDRSCISYLKSNRS